MFITILRHTSKVKGRFYSISRQPFPILSDGLSDSKFELTAAKEKSQKLIEELQNINKLCYNGGGKRGQLLHVKTNKKVLPRERVASLFDDPNDILELCLQAGVGMEYGDIFGGSCISAIGKIHGVYCSVFANDATLKAGTSYPITLKKVQRSNIISNHCFLPRICLIDSGGAFLPLQAEIFPDKFEGGRQFYNIAVDSAVGTSSFTLVCGSCTAGGAYVPKMSEEAAIVDKIGTVYLGGPPLVKAALGEDVTHEDLGGAMLHCSTSGGTDYFCPTEYEGFDMIKDFASTLNIEAEADALPDNDALYSSENLDVLCGLEVFDRKTLYGIISRLTDGSRFREFKKEYGCNLVTGFSSIGRERIGILANYGPLSYQDGLKGSHFVQICEHRNIPIVFLQNSGPEEMQEAFLSSLSEEENGITLKGRASMIGSISCSTSFKITINISGCHGDEHYTMCGPSFDPDFVFAWPGAKYTHSMSYSKESSSEEGQDTPERRKKPSKSAFQLDPHGSLYWSSRALNDGTILPSETRKVLIKCIRIYQQKKRTKQFNKTFPVFRF